MDSTYSYGVAERRFDYIVKSLIKTAGFTRIDENDLYQTIDGNGNVRTGHERVCQNAAGVFISHPLCKKCHNSAGYCRQFVNYADAVKWADDKKTTCWECTSERTKTMIERKAEAGGYEDDVEDGAYCACPLGGDY